MSIQPSILCPCCGARIEIEARQVQTELALGPIEVTLKDRENKLDAPSATLATIGDRPTGRVSESFSDRSTERDSTDRPAVRSAASCEEDFFRSVQKIVGERDWTLNFHVWRSYYEQSPRAVAYAIEDWKRRTPDQQRAIKNRAAWLTDRFKRAKAEIETAQKRKHA